MTEPRTIVMIAHRKGEPDWGVVAARILLETAPPDWAHIFAPSVLPRQTWTPGQPSRVGDVVEMRGAYWHAAVAELRRSMQEAMAEATVASSPDMEVLLATFAQHSLETFRRAGGVVIDSLSEMAQAFGSAGTIVGAELEDAARWRDPREPDSLADYSVLYAAAERLEPRESDWELERFCVLEREPMPDFRAIAPGAWPRLTDKQRHVVCFGGHPDPPNYTLC